MNSTTTALPAYDESPIADKLAAQLGAVRRRAVPMAVAFGSILAIALLFALLLPATYRSAGTILIEQQEIPEDFVRSAVSSFADQRVQIISQRVMTSSNLLEIIEKHELYDADRKSVPRERLVERVREDIGLEMISADVVDPRRGGVTKATIAFDVSFKSHSPELASKVANDLVSLYLRENLETRKQLAEGSTQFLANEAERLRRRTEELEQKIAQFKRDNLERLPEFTGASGDSIARMSEELREVESRIRSLDQQIVLLDSQLVQLSPTATVVSETGERWLSPGDRLRANRAQLTSLSARYGPGHPDVRRLQREIAKLEGDIAQGTTEAGDSKSSPPDNPAYVQISAQREVAAGERATLVERRAELQRMIGRLERAQLEMPEIDREYRAMLLESQAEQQKFAEVRQKQLAAQLSQNLESEQKGERFTLIDPPVTPQQPISPNRWLIAIIGLLLAAAAAVLVLVLLEALDSRVRGRRQLVTMLGEPPLAIIPRVPPAATVTAPTSQNRRAMALALAGLLVAATGLALIHLLFKPLDVLWAILLRRMGVG
jgi:polysaccharide chain length determinant protein (PEP-CTERM system associated)